PGGGGRGEGDARGEARGAQAHGLPLHGRRRDPSRRPGEVDDQGHRVEGEERRRRRGRRVAVPVFAIDPGTDESAFVRYDAEGQRLLEHGRIPNPELLSRLRVGRTWKDTLAIEM